MNELQEQALVEARERVAAARDALDVEVWRRDALVKAALESGAKVRDVARAAQIPQGFIRSKMGR